MSSATGVRPDEVCAACSGVEGQTSAGKKRAISNVATGDLLFKSPDGKWPAGTYNLVLNHDKARAELPITLQ